MIPAAARDPIADIAPAIARLLLTTRARFFLYDLARVARQQVA